MIQVARNIWSGISYSEKLTIRGISLLQGLISIMDSQYGYIWFVILRVDKCLMEFVHILGGVVSTDIGCIMAS